jgi:hypothetical protein
MRRRLYRRRRRTRPLNTSLKVRNPQEWRWRPERRAAKTHHRKRICGYHPRKPLGNRSSRPRPLRKSYRGEPPRRRRQGKSRLESSLTICERIQLLSASFACRAPHELIYSRPSSRAPHRSGRRGGSIGIVVADGLHERRCAKRGTEGSNPAPSSRQSVSLPQPLSKVENPAFRAGLRGWLGDRVGRDAGMF